MQTWDLKAKIYNSMRSLPLIRAIYAAEKNRILHLLGEREFIKHLDLGTGTGSSLEVFRHSRWLVVSDFSREMIRITRCRHRGPAILLNAEAGLPFKNESFDLVSAIGVVEYVCNLNSLLAECRRITVRNGFFLLTNSPPRRLNRLRALTGDAPMLRPGTMLEAVLAEQGWCVFKKSESLLQEQYLCARDESAYWQK